MLKRFDGTGRIKQGSTVVIYEPGRSGKKICIATAKAVIRDRANDARVIVLVEDMSNRKTTAKK